MQRAEDDRTDRSGGSSGADSAPGTQDRRRPTVARFRFEPDPRDLRRLLGEVEVGLGSTDPLLRRNVRLLIGEVVSRLLMACPQTAVQLDLEIKADSVRVDITQRGNERCDVWNALDEITFSDLTSASGTRSPSERRSLVRDRKAVSSAHRSASQRRGDGSALLTKARLWHGMRDLPRGVATFR